MKRFIFLFVLGALSISTGQVALSLGVHPDRFAGVGFLAQSSLGLIFGLVVIALGMLGLAEGHERVAVRLYHLLTAKQVGTDLQIAIRDGASLHHHDRNFWKAYMLSALAVCLFLSGFLGLSIFFARYSYLLYLAGLAGGGVLLFYFTLTMSLRALRAIRGIYQAMDNSTQLLASQPECTAAAAPTSGYRWKIRRQSTYRANQQFDSRQHSRGFTSR